MNKRTLELIAEKRLSFKDKRIQMNSAMIPSIAVNSHVQGINQIHGMFNEFLDGIFNYIDENLKEIEKSLKEESQAGQ